MTNSTKSSNGREKSLKERWLLSLGRMQMAGRMIGIHQLWSGMKAESRTADQWRDANMRLIYGQQPASQNEADEMGDHLILGDQKTENHYHPKQGMGTLGKLATAGALLAGGAGVGALATSMILDYLKGDPPPVMEDTDTDTGFELRLGDPP